MLVLKTLQHFLKKEQGVTLPFLAIMFMTLIAAVGLATDVARKQLAQSRLSFAVDAAGLAASSTDTQHGQYLDRTDKVPYRKLSNQLPWHRCTDDQPYDQS